MLSKNQVKLITSLKHKKYRLQHNLFVAEGIKTINELMNSHFKLHHLFATASFNINDINETLISEAELKKISFLKTPNKALAVFEIPETKQDSGIGLDNLKQRLQLLYPNKHLLTIENGDSVYKLALKLNTI